MMFNFIDFLLDNLFIVIIAITGLFSFFNRMLAKNQRHDAESASEGGRKSTIGETLRRVQETIDETLESMEEKETPPASARRSNRNNRTVQTEKSQPLGRFATSADTTFEQMRDEQLNRLREQYAPIAVSDDADEGIKPLHNGAKHRREEKTAKNTPVEVDLSSRLNKEGLIESVVMAEILGPPRSRKSYRSHFLER